MKVLNIFHVLVAISMVAFILVQRGPGATAGAAFGSGASGTVFGSRGAGSFLTRSTWVLATFFCLISLTMAVVVSRDLGAPDSDLGVISGGAPTEQTITDDPGVTPVMDDPSTDLPTLDIEEVQPAADDLPEIDAGQTTGEEGSSDGSDE